MDGQQFDDLIRKLGTLASRRSIVKALGLGALASAGVAGGDDARAKGKRKKGRKTQPNDGLQSADSIIPLEQQCAACPALPAPVRTEGNNTNCGYRNNSPVAGSSGTLYSCNGQYSATKPANTEACGSCYCALRWTVDSTGKLLSFGPVAGEPVCSVSSVIVKGGDAYNTYTFDPATFCATGLVSPDNSSGGPAGISHFEFCAGDVSCCEKRTCPTNGCTTAAQCDTCGGVLATCDCASDGLSCTTDTCTPTGVGVNGTCSYVAKTCTAPNACKVNCRCVEPSGDCVCDDRVCPSRDMCTSECDARHPDADIDGCLHTCCDQTCGPDECGEVEKCGEIVDCGPCACSSCTIGYYSQNNVCNGLTLGGEDLDDLPFPCASGDLAEFCADAAEEAGYSGPLTIGTALELRGKAVICAQAAAAYLNQNIAVIADDSDLVSCADSLDWGTVCADTLDRSAINALLTGINEGHGDEHCPLKGCNKKRKNK